MRLPFATLALLTIAPLASLAATAQGPDCTQQADPCFVDMSVDETGIVELSLANFTVDEWHTLSVTNEDTSAAHTVTLSGYDVSLTVGPVNGDDVEVQFTKTGCFILKDMPTGAQRQIRVVQADSIDFEDHVSSEKDPCVQAVQPPPTGESSHDGSSSAAGKSSQKGAPGLAAPLAALAVLAVVLLRRRA